MIGDKSRRLQCECYSQRCWSTIALAGVAFADTADFDQAAMGKPPAGWTATQTGFWRGSMDGCAG